MAIRQLNRGNMPASLARLIWPSNVEDTFSYLEHFGADYRYDRVRKVNAEVTGTPVVTAEGMTTIGDLNFLTLDFAGMTDLTIINIAKLITEPLLSTSGGTASAMHLVSNHNVTRGGTAIIAQGSAGAPPSSDRIRGRARWGNSDTLTELAGNQRGWRARAIRVSSGGIIGPSNFLFDLTQNLVHNVAPIDDGRTRTINSSDRFRIGAAAEAGWNGSAIHAITWIIARAVPTLELQRIIGGWLNYRAPQLHSPLSSIVYSAP